MNIDPEVPSSVRELAAVLSQPKPMRRGSVSERTMKCGKASCPCQHDPAARHGPYYSLTRPVAGKTQSRYLSPQQAAIVQQQIAAGHQFRTTVDALWEKCEAWADSQLEAASTAAAEEAEKGGSKRASKAKPSRRSNRS